MRVCKIVLLLVILIVAGAAAAHAQGVPPKPVAAFINPGSGWTPWTTTNSAGLVGSTPPEVALYCQNGASWAPCTGTGGGAPTSCANGGTYVCSSGTYSAGAIPHSTGNGSTTLVAGSLQDDGTNLVYSGSGGISTFTGNYKIGDNHSFVNGSGPQMQAGVSSVGTGWIDTMATPLTITSMSGFASNRQVGGANYDFVPTSGSASFASLLVNPAVNATSTGTAYGMVVAPVFTAMTGGKTKIAGFGSSTGLNGSGYIEVAYIGTSGDFHPKVYTVSSLPSASTIGAGGVLLVSDSNTSTPGTCTGGGSTVMIAVSTGSVWNCR
jgi:hypothetical protein